MYENSELLEMVAELELELEQKNAEIAALQNKLFEKEKR